MELFRSVLANEEDVLVHSYILVESAALLQRRLGLEAALTFLKETDAFQVHWVGSEDHRRAATLMEDRGRRGLSLVDCVSFIVMRQFGVRQALAFDSDFEREGFELLYAGGGG